jgi:predicted anti-sigma-YlaC factor YlaD
MNHLPFKEWLLSEEPLSLEQDRAFQEHLRGCAECQRAQAAWVEVHHLFKRTAQAAPAAGFTNRWQERLAARRARRQHIQLGLALAGGALLALALIVIVATQLSWIIQSPTQFVLAILAQIASLFVLFSSLQDYLTVFLGSFPLIPLIGAVLSFGFISLLSVLWLTAYQQLVIARRFVK